MGYNYWNGTEAEHPPFMMKAAGYSKDEDNRIRNTHIGYRNSYWQVLPELAIFQVTEAVKRGESAGGRE